MEAAKRNERVTAIMDALFEKAGKGDHRVDAQTKRDLEAVLAAKTWGFREILLVIVVARLLDPKYRASSKLYECNPRALYEGPIRSALRDRRIPHRKSGPLNIAKATVGISPTWAAQRRPSEVAERIVRLVKEIEGMSEQNLTNFATTLCAMFLEESKRVALLSTEISPQANPAYLCSLSRQLIDKVPDGGNTPQRIAGLLLHTYHKRIPTGLVVSGHEDEASVTSTTSRKPGDLTVEKPDGVVVCTYEVTVKPFSQARLEESHDTVTIFNNASQSRISEVVVICRKEDCHPDIHKKTNSEVYLGCLEYEGIAYHFVNIYEWIPTQLVGMPPDARLAFYEELHNYVSDPNTSEKVKLFWKRIHEKRVLG